MNASTPKFLAEGIKLVSVCPVCQKDTATEAHVLRADRTSGLVHVSCGHCEHAMMAHLERQQGGVNCVGIVTDLSLTDARRSMRRPAVAVDEVLAVHEALTSGTFADLLLEPRCS